MTREASLETLQEKSLGWCPTIKAQCYKRCVCYDGGRIVGKNNCHVIAPQCDHSNHTFFRQVENV